MGKVVVIGSSNTDMVFGCNTMPAPGETISGHSFDIIAGGKGANQAVAAARAGADVTFIAKVGNDDFGRSAIRGYQQDKINTEYISIDPDLPSGTAMIMVDDSGQNSIVVVPGANGKLRPEDISNDVIRDADVVLLQLEIPLRTVQHVLELAKEYNTLTILNPAPAVKLSDSVLSLVDLITPNETETSILTGIFPTNATSIRAAANELLKYVESVIITLGDKGSYLATKDNALQIPVEPVKAVDSTAAGDVFNGYLAAALADNKSIEMAIKEAGKAAARSVLSKGAQPSIPYLEDL